MQKILARKLPVQGLWKEYRPTHRHVKDGKLRSEEHFTDTENICVTVIRKVKQIAKSIVRPFAILKGKEYEVDEMRTYIGNKQRLYWVVYAMRRDTKEVIDFKVGKRNLKTLGKVIDTVLLSEAKKIFTDGYELYKSLILEEIHRQRKCSINHIERKNLSIRTHLKRLSRKSICFSKSKEMLEACLKIYFWSSSCCYCRARTWWSHPATITPSPHSLPPAWSQAKARVFHRHLR